MILVATSLAAQQVEIPSALQNPFTTVTMRADSQKKTGSVYELVGHAEVGYRDATLLADRISFDESTGQVEASGRISFTDPKAHLEAASASYNIVSKKATFLDVQGYVQTPKRRRSTFMTASSAIYLRAREVDRLNEDTYLVLEGRVTSCKNERSGWSLAVRSARLTVGDKLVSYGDVFRLVGVPLLYSPVLESSIARNPRQTGFLIPALGDSSQKGRIIGDAFFWAINPSADIMAGVDDYSLRGVATLGRFRAAPSQTSQVEVHYFGVNDHGSGPLRSERAPGQSLRAEGFAQNLGGGFRGVLDMDYVNSLAFRNTWSGNFNEAVSSEARQTAFASKSFNGYSLNFFADRYQNFLSAQQVPGNSIVIRQTPSISFDGSDHELGRTPLYFSLDSSAAGVGREQPGFATPVFTERLDVHPELTLRSPDFLGFHVTPSFGVEATRYGASLLAARDPLTRLLGDVSLDVRPPSFERVFSRRIHHYRLKHVIEPDIQYKLVRAEDPRDISDIIRFDETDVLTETNEIEYSIKSTLYGRPDAPGDDSSAPPARELASLSLSQKYYFDPTFGGALAAGQNSFASTLDLTGFAFAQGRHLSPIVSVLRVAPFSNFDTELRADISPSGGGVLNAGITSGVHRGDFGLEATDFFVDRTELLGIVIPALPSDTTASVRSSHLFNARVTYGRPDRRGLSGAFGFNYNFTNGLANALVSQVTYNFECFGIDFGYNRFNLGPLRQENQFRFAITLSNVGSFGNLRSRDRLYQSGNSDLNEGSP
jgi:LPS-assembly protein